MQGNNHALGPLHRPFCPDWKHRISPPKSKTQQCYRPIHAPLAMSMLPVVVAATEATQRPSPLSRLIPFAMHWRHPSYWAGLVLSLFLPF
jgi:hypothetical protein